jgi:hypothetical protein
MQKKIMKKFRGYNLSKKIIGNISLVVGVPPTME